MSATSTTSPQQIDASCRLPLFALWGGAAVWLVLSSVFGLIASIKFHNPNFMSGCAVSSYGRMFPAATNLLVYGFCIPAGLGVALWLLARLGRAVVTDSWLVAVGAKLWHFGVLVGLVGILAGQTTGHEWLEMPRFASVILFFAYLFIAVRAFVVHHGRTERTLYPSQWFVLAALFWFPWIFSTATLLLQIYPVRGMAQASIAWWYGGNLIVVWLGLIGLAAALYFLPKLLGRPLQTYYLALFAFLTLIFFGTWTGFPGSAALPAWIPSLSTAGKLMMAIPAVTVITILILTSRGATAACTGGTLCFTKAGLWAFGLSSLLLTISALPSIGTKVDFTWFGQGQSTLQIYGFFAMVIFGAIYFILPRVAGVELYCTKPVRFHFWAAGIGAVVLALALVAGGVAQGAKLADPKVDFLGVTKASVMFLRLGSLGELLILLGNLLFLFNISAVLVRYYRAVGCQFYATATAQLEPTGVKS